MRWTLLISLGLILMATTGCLKDRDYFLREPLTVHLDGATEAVILPAGTHIKRSWFVKTNVAFISVAGTTNAGKLDAAGARLTEVWVSDGPPADLPAPAGFRVTPRAAYDAVVSSGRLSLKHPWACYHDNARYYIFDIFGRGSSPKNAIRYGVRVNGATGAVEEPE